MCGGRSRGGEYGCAASHSLAHERDTAVSHAAWFRPARLAGSGRAAALPGRLGIDESFIREDDSATRSGDPAQPALPPDGAGLARDHLCRCPDHIEVIRRAASAPSPAGRFVASTPPRRQPGQCRRTRALDNGTPRRPNSSAPSPCSCRSCLGTHTIAAARPASSAPS